MTIRQLKDRCWELSPPLPGYDRESHYDTRAEARKALREALDEDSGVNPATKPRQLEDRCWLVQCDGECEMHIDEEGECYISHCGSRQIAEEVVAAYKWACVGDLVFCPEDAPADGQVPPPSPAELEAAGQLPLPGVA
jgi:hypothetical protein